MHALQDAWAGLQEADFEFQSALLRSMAAGGAFVDMRGPLEELLGYTDWDLATERGRIVPHPGSDARYDAAEEQVLLTPDLGLLVTCPVQAEGQGCILSVRRACGNTTPAADHRLPEQQLP